MLFSELDADKSGTATWPLMLWPSESFSYIQTHDGSMGRTVYLPIHEWLVFMVNVGKYTQSHGSYGFGCFPKVSFLFAKILPRIPHKTVENPPHHAKGMFMKDIQTSQPGKTHIFFFNKASG